METTDTQQLIAAGMHPAELTTVDRDDAIKIIRDALKRRSGKTWSVTGGRGTAWGWITITAPPARRVGHDYDAATGATTENPDASKDRRWYMSDADCVELGELLGHVGPVHCQGETVPASSAYRRCAIEAALGVTALSTATPYWD